MYSACGNAALPALGFPIRESADHRLFSAYPRLIAAVHALHRLLVPRHPPCALHILTVITHPAEAEHAVIPVTLEKLCSFQGSRTQRLPPRTQARVAGRTGRSVSQNSTACETASTSARPQRPPGGLSHRVRSGPVDVLGPGRSSDRVVRPQDGSGAPILEASLERR